MINSKKISCIIIEDGKKHKYISKIFSTRSKPLYDFYVNHVVPIYSSLLRVYDNMRKLK